MIQPAYIYRAVVVRVVDADTLVATIDLGLRVSTTVHIRVRGIDAPELSTPEGKIAKGHVVGLFALRPNILVQTYKDQQSFSRWIADVYLDDGTLFATWLATRLESLSADTVSGPLMREIRPENARGSPAGKRTLR